MNCSPDEDPQALRNWLFRYAQDLQALMAEHRELQRRHFAMLQSHSRAVLAGAKPFCESVVGAEKPLDREAHDSKKVETLSWRETLTVWLVISACTAVFAGFCFLFWYRHVRG